MEQKGEPMAKSGAAPVREVPGVNQADSGTQLAGTWPKAQVKRTEQQVVQEEALETRDLYQGINDIWQRRVLKAAEVKLPLPFPETLFSLILKWKVKRTIEWDDPGN